MGLTWSSEGTSEMSGIDVNNLDQLLGKLCELTGDDAEYYKNIYDKIWKHAFANEESKTDYYKTFCSYLVKWIQQYVSECKRTPEVDKVCIYLLIKVKTRDGNTLDYTIPKVKTIVPPK